MPRLACDHHARGASAARRRLRRGPAAILLGLPLALAAPVAVQAHEPHSHEGGFTAPGGNAPAPVDIVHARVSLDGRVATFHMAVSGTAGSAPPTPAGGLAGAPVVAYVWPTAIDPATVGFGSGAGILALAVTAHPDFDDTPLFDENRDGDLANDGQAWHSHWVVLGPDAGCGDGALKVLDIAEGDSPPLPATWPGLPLLIDSPGLQPVFHEDTLEVRVPFADPAAVAGKNHDAVTAGLTVNGNLHAPLLCVTAVSDVASGDLSLPGRIEVLP